MLEVDTCLSRELIPCRAPGTFCSNAARATAPASTDLFLSAHWVCDHSSLGLSVTKAAGAASKRKAKNLRETGYRLVAGH